MIFIKTMPQCNEKSASLYINSNYSGISTVFEPSISRSRLPILRTKSCFPWICVSQIFIPDFRNFRFFKPSSVSLGGWKNWHTFHCTFTSVIRSGIKRNKNTKSSSLQKTEIDDKQSLLATLVGSGSKKKHFIPCMNGLFPVYSYCHS